MSDLGSLTWPEVDAAVALLFVPLGSVEQHGPHLPLDTDTRVAVAVANEVATELRDVAEIVVAPALAYGASGEHAGFAGTLSLGQDAFGAAVIEIVRSADHFSGVVLVNGHGGNTAAASRAAALARREGRRVVMVSCGVAGGDAHAGRTETSLLLHLEPTVVRIDRAEVGDVRPWAELREEVMAAGVAAVSPNGVLGDPRGATAAEGAALFERICRRITDALRSELAEWADG